MKKALSLLVVAFLVMGWSTTSIAGNPYASANIGLTWFSDIDGTEIDAADRDDTLTIGCDSGITLTGAIGYDMGSIRAEAELGYQSNDAASLTLYDDGDIDEKWEWSGDISLTTFMFNGYYDIKPMTDSDVELFLTAGIGGVFYDFDNVGDSDDEDYRGSINGSTWAYQLGAGIAIPVGKNMTVDARYRYLNAAEFTTEDDYAGFDDESFNLDLESHSALIGLRYNF